MSTLLLVLVGVGPIILHIGMSLSFLGNPFNPFVVTSLVTPIVLLMYVYWLLMDPHPSWLKDATCLMVLYAWLI